jgi:hypothetical protein
MNKFVKDFILFFAENNGDGSKSALIKKGFNRFHSTRGCPVTAQNRMHRKYCMNGDFFVHFYGESCFRAAFKSQKDLLRGSIQFKEYYRERRSGVPRLNIIGID